MACLTVDEVDHDASVSAEDVASIIGATRVAGIRLDEIHAGPLTYEGSAPVYAVRTNVPKFAYIDDPGQILVRIEHEVSIGADEDLKEATEMSVAHVVTFALEEDLATTPAALSAWVESNVYFLAYPYVRETLTSLTTRMGLPPLTLDYLSRDARPFHDASDEIRDQVAEAP